MDSAVYATEHVKKMLNTLGQAFCFRACFATNGCHIPERLFSYVYIIILFEVFQE